MNRQNELRDKLADLLGVEGGLSGWDMKFIDSADKWVGSFTDNQAKALDRLWDVHCLGTNSRSVRFSD